MNKYQKRESRLVKKLASDHFRFGFSPSKYRRERRIFRATVRFAKMMAAAGCTVRLCDPDELPCVVITRAKEVHHE